MVFYRVLHDGLSAVINRGKKAKIIFVKGVFETANKEEIEYLVGLGYAHEKEATPKAPAKVKIVWNVYADGEAKPVDTFKTKKAAEEWILKQENWESLEVKKD